MRPFACFLAFAGLISAVSWAQGGQGAPDLGGEPDGTLVAPPTVKKAPERAKDSRPEKRDKASASEPAREMAGRASVPPLVVKQISDEDLHAVWAKWKEANLSKNAQAEQAARKELRSTQLLIGSTNLELWAVGLLRAAKIWEAAGDSGAAVEIAASATQLAPELPATWFLLSRLYFAADPSRLDRSIGALWRGTLAQFRDPRYLRPLVADLAAIALLALLVTAVAVVSVLLLRRGYYFLYDFHFLFPRAAARWQTSALGLLVLVLPVVFHFGLAFILLSFFAAVTMYLPRRDGVVVAVLVSLLGLVPTGAQVLVEQTAFAQTPAEDLYQIERGGPGSQLLVQRYEKLASEDKVGFAERFVLGHFHLNRGHLAEAVSHLKSALSLRPDDAPARIALAKALFLSGDLENSRGILEAVKQTARSATVLYDLGRVYQRRLQVYGESNAGEVDKASSNAMEARQLDPSLPKLEDDEPLAKNSFANALLKTLPLGEGELLALAKGDVVGRQVYSQLSSMLVGELPASLGPLFPALLALLVLALGRLGKVLGVSTACTRCGRAVSARGDPELPSGSLMCTQCINVFVKTDVVGPSVKLRKQMQVSRYHHQLTRVSTILGVLCSGMGDVFSGAPVRGSIYGFLFALTVVGALAGPGVVRPPFEGVPLVVRVLPLAALFLTVYPLSLIRLRRKAGS